MIGYGRCSSLAATAYRGRVPEAHDGFELAVLQSCNGWWRKNMMGKEKT